MIIALNYGKFVVKNLLDIFLVWNKKHEKYSYKILFSNNYLMNKTSKKSTGYFVI